MEPGQTDVLDNLAGKKPKKGKLLSYIGIGAVALILVSGGAYAAFVSRPRNTTVHSNTQTTPTPSKSAVTTATPTPKPGEYPRDTNTSGDTYNTYTFADRFTFTTDDDGDHEVQIDLSFPYQLDETVSREESNNSQMITVKRGDDSLILGLNYGKYPKQNTAQVAQVGTPVLATDESKHIAKLVSQGTTTYYGVDCDSCATKLTQVMNLDSSIPLKLVPNGMQVHASMHTKDATTEKAFDELVSHIKVRSKILPNDSKKKSLIIPLNAQYSRYVNFEYGFEVTYPVKAWGTNQCIKGGATWTYPKGTNLPIVDIVPVEDIENKTVYFADKQGVVFVDSKSSSGKISHVQCSVRDFTLADLRKIPSSIDSTVPTFLNTTRILFGSFADYANIFDKEHGPGCKAKRDLTEQLPVGQQCSLNYVYKSGADKDANFSYTYTIGQSAKFTSISGTQDFYLEVVGK